MTTRVKSYLRKWRDATRPISESCQIKYVFFNPQKPETHIKSVKTAWHNALKAAGVRACPIYWCRHTWATRLAESGVVDMVVDQLLGHAQKGVLSRYQVRVLEYFREAIRSLEKFRDAKTVTPRIVDLNETAERPYPASKWIN
jgi:integrase